MSYDRLEKIINKSLKKKKVGPKSDQKLVRAIMKPLI